MLTSVWQKMPGGKRERKGHSEGERERVTLEERERERGGKWGHCAVCVIKKLGFKSSFRPLFLIRKENSQQSPCGRHAIIYFIYELYSSLCTTCKTMCPLHTMIARRRRLALDTTFLRAHPKRWKQ